MATLVEKPPDLGSDIDSKSTIDVEINDLKGLQLKETKIGKHGVLQLKNTTAIHVTSPMIPETIVKTEKGVIGKPPIIRKSKKLDYPDDRTEGRSTRPGSEITIPDSRSRDGDSDLGDEKIGRIKSPMSVQVERKLPPNNTPASRVLSDYTRNSGGSTKYHVMVPGQGHIDPLPSPAKRMHQSQTRTRRIPAKLIRLTTVTMSAR